MKTVNYTVREMAMYQAGIEQGTGNGMKIVVERLRQAFNQIIDSAEQQAQQTDDGEVGSSLTVFKTWLEEFQPWIDEVITVAERHRTNATQQTDAIGPPSPNLRKRIASAIVGAVDGFTKG